MNVLVLNVGSSTVKFQLIATDLQVIATNADRRLARGQIVGDDYGMLKLLVSPETHALLGVHVFGTSATELVHVGQAIMGCGGTVDYLVDAVLNYPTLSEAYKVAALDATNKIRALEQFA